MHLATDYIHPSPGRGMCRVRVFLPDDPERDSPVVLCTELPSNRGESVTNAAERIAGSVIAAFKLPTPLVWIEHYPPEVTDGASETFDLVVFGHYEVREIVRAEAEGPTEEIGPPNWKRLDRGSTETLVGHELEWWPPPAWPRHGPCPLRDRRSFCSPGIPFARQDQDPKRPQRQATRVEGGGR